MEATKEQIETCRLFNDEAALRLEQLRTFLKGKYSLSLFCRNLEKEDADIFVSTDDYEKVIEAIGKLHESPNAIEVNPK